MYLNRLIEHHEVLENISLIVRKSKRAKRIIVKLNPSYRSVELVYPPSVKQSQAEAFLRSQRDWLIERVKAMKERIILIEQPKITLFGCCFQVLTRPRTGQGDLSQLSDNQLILYANSKERAAICLRVLIQNHAKETFDRLVRHYAAQIDEVPLRVLVKEMKSRWGSCSYEKAIALSWRLAFAPKDVAHYVVAHEVAHMKEMNHSNRFWQVVAALYPGYKKPRAWLSKHGNCLHAYE